jgi:hypothetical protein
MGRLRCTGVGWGVWLQGSCACCLPPRGRARQCRHTVAPTHLVLRLLL